MNPTEAINTSTSQHLTTPTAQSTTANNSCLLLQLPQEIQLSIYNHCIPPWTLVLKDRHFTWPKSFASNRYRAYARQSSSSNNNTLALLRTNKAIHSLAHTLPYASWQCTSSVDLTNLSIGGSDERCGELPNHPLQLAEPYATYLAQSKVVHVMLSQLLYPDFADYFSQLLNTGIPPVIHVHDRFVLKEETQICMNEVKPLMALLQKYRLWPWDWKPSSVGAKTDSINDTDDDNKWTADQVQSNDNLRQFVQDELRQRVDTNEINHRYWYPFANALVLAGSHWMNRDTNTNKKLQWTTLFRIPDFWDDYTFVAEYTCAFCAEEEEEEEVNDTSSGESDSSKIPPTVEVTLSSLKVQRMAWESCPYPTSPGGIFPEKDELALCAQGDKSVWDFCVFITPES